MSNNLSKLLVPSSINLLVERALGGHEFLEGSVFHDVPGVEVDDVVGGLQVAEVVGDADRCGIFRQLVERLLGPAAATNQWFFPVFTRAPAGVAPSGTGRVDVESWRFQAVRASETPRPRLRLALKKKLASVTY